jgi:hypothetical protein
VGGGIVLTVNRGYWDGGGYDGEEFADAVAIAVVDGRAEGGAGQLMLGRAMKTMMNLGYYLLLPPPDPAK